MSAPDLPPALKAYLAAPAMREHHALWHFIRDFGDFLDDEQKHRLSAWLLPPDRLRGMQQSGIDFLGMHRAMIHEARDFAQNHNEAADLTGWDPIPWNPKDPDWPMPPTYPQIPDGSMKEPSATDHYRQEVQSELDSTDWLKAHSLDELGIAIENGIHKWMHIHWSAAPWFQDQPNQDINDVHNDFLACPYSSHVNKHFWKLHGWIDQRITLWGQIHREDPDLSDAWLGPNHDHGMMMGGVITRKEIELACTIFSKNHDADLKRLRMAATAERAAILDSLLKMTR